MEYVIFNKESDDFTVKYAPNKIKEIVGCEKQVNTLSNWLINYESSRRSHIEFMRMKKTTKNKKRVTRVKKKTDSKDSADFIAIPQTGKKRKKTYTEASCALVTGDHGCGKTSIVKAVLNSFKYKIRTVNFARLTSGTNSGNINIKSFTNSILDCDDVYTLMNDQHMNSADNSTRVASKIAIIIDEVESISSNTEKEMIRTMLDINSMRWKAPVIFISNNKHKKLITLLKSECFHVHIYEPEVDDMMNLLVRIGVKENMVMEDKMIAHSIIEHSRFDYRKMVSTLQMLSKVYMGEQIDKEKLASYLKFTDQRDVDRTIYEYTIKLFTEFISIEKSLRIFEGDKVNMPLMVQQNHFMAVSNYIKDDDLKFKVAEEITNSLAIGDIIENYIYSDQNWDLHEIQGHYSCVFPSYQIIKHTDTAKLKADAKYPFYKPVFVAQYPKDLNRTSTRNINWKNIKAASEFFNDMTVSDYVRANQLIRQLLGDKRVDECGDMIEPYNLTHDGVSYILKIDKVTGTKKVIPKEIDKMVKQITVEPLEKIKITKKKATKQTKSRVTKSVKTPVAKPKVAKPKVAKPKVSKPKVSKPKVAKPNVAKPNVTRPRAKND
jgi:tRNA A37 threonylcarbamoyladenosine biosynthesis protein TsaE